MRGLFLLLLPLPVLAQALPCRTIAVSDTTWDSDTARAVLVREHLRLVDRHPDSLRIQIRERRVVAARCWLDLRMGTDTMSLRIWDVETMELLRHTTLRRRPSDPPWPAILPTALRQLLGV